MSTTGTRYGWYSQQMYDHQMDNLRRGERGGSRPSIYRRPDGSEVLVTCISDEPDPEWLKWPDRVCVGPVADWVRCA